MLSDLLQAGILITVIYLFVLVRDVIKTVGPTMPRIEQRLDYLSDEVGRIETQVNGFGAALDEPS